MGVSSFWWWQQCIRKQFATALRKFLSCQSSHAHISRDLALTFFDLSFSY